ncbi:hypothetical protein SAMN02744786_3405 [Stenotrophomonas sp. CC120222-04]|nr:hypothetical protein SAMN02744786_3405 [Stenotrophomonas sp. CC120222-04]
MRFDPALDVQALVNCHGKDNASEPRTMDGA